MRLSHFVATRGPDKLRVVITQPELPTDVEYVRVMSLHKSKGLTADLVVVADLIEGLIPRVEKDLPEADQDRQLREQRRLLYVAMTRTRQVLVLSSVARLRKEVAFKVGARPAAVGVYSVTTIASRFMDELGIAAPRARRGKELIGLPGGPFDIVYPDGASLMQPRRGSR